MGKSGVQSHVSTRINVNISDCLRPTWPRTFLGAEGSWELKVAAQESQKLFQQEIEECLIAPLPPAARRCQSRHTGQKRKGKESAQVSDSSFLAGLSGLDFQVPAN